MQAKALWYVAPGKAELREEALAPAADLADGMVPVRALFGAVSRGTERLVCNGKVPPGEYERMRPPFMAGVFPFPVKYGYATVGRVMAGPLREQVVFALHPHQDHFSVPAEAIVEIPQGIPPQRAVLAANMETALNALWDGAPGPCDRIAVVGAGVVGLLAARLAARIPGTEVTVVDIAPGRAELARALGLSFASPEAAPGGCDLVFHASGTGAGLATALRVAGDESTIVELSWYGAGEVAVPLGERFHSGRLRLISSQVGKVAPSHRPRWSYGRRLAAAVALLDDTVLDDLLAPAVDFADLPARLPALLASEADARCPLIRYAVAPD
jgi:NADPH:quinone reductase-like Zn-dependent oxidoreductase